MTKILNILTGEFADLWALDCERRTLEIEESYIYNRQIKIFGLSDYQALQYVLRQYNESFDIRNQYILISEQKGGNYGQKRLPT